MFCCGLRKCKLMIWINDTDYRLINVDYNENYVREQVERLREFYVKKMLNRIVDDIDDRLVFSKVFNKFMHF